MNSLSFIAFRHLKSRHSLGFISFISYLSIIGLGIGVAVLILTLSILNGFENEIRSKIVGFDGHIRLRGYLEGSIPFHNPLLDSVLQSIPEIIDRAPYVRHAAIIRAGSRTEGVLVEGISSEKAKSVFRTPDLLVEGEFEYTAVGSGYEGVIMGQALTEKLGISTGDRVTFLDLEAVGTPGKAPRVGQFALSAIYDTGLREYDENVVYMSLSSAQRLFGYHDQLSGEILKITDAASAEKVAEEIEAAIGFPYLPSTWRERHENLFAWLSIQKYPITIIFALIAIVAIVNIASSLTMIVMEKTRDIGVLRAMGHSRRDISKLFLLEGGIIGGLGVALGMIFTLVLGFVQKRYGIISIPEDVYFMGELPVLFQPLHFILVGMAGFLLAVVATVYPAWKASGVLPAEAVRYE